MDKNMYRSTTLLIIVLAASWLSLFSGCGFVNGLIYPESSKKIKQDSTATAAKKEQIQMAAEAKADSATNKPADVDKNSKSAEKFSTDAKPKAAEKVQNTVAAGEKNKSSETPPVEEAKKNKLSEPEAKISGLVDRKLVDGENPQKFVCDTLQTIIKALLKDSIATYDRMKLATPKEFLFTKNPFAFGNIIDEGYLKRVLSEIIDEEYVWELHANPSLLKEAVTMKLYFNSFNGNLCTRIQILPDVNIKYYRIACLGKVVEDTTGQ